LDSQIDSSELKRFCFEHGADLVGVADLTLLKERFDTRPSGLLNGYLRGISIGISLKGDIVEGISEGPTASYADHYREVNRFLDELARSTTGWLGRLGFQSLAIPASDVVDQLNWCGALSHRAVGRLAGLGWTGKSLMLINPRYGPRFRMATILTEMPLVADKPLENRCGGCRICAEACIAKAIKNTGTDSFYEHRVEAVDINRCITVLKEFRARPEIAAMVCGVCVKVCPYGQK
jgi:epoxyqueuosine reductase QueG